ncbi:MAG: serine/threonine protein kinase [Betaproteobacteria bacterium]|nr:serine/threonine protein kinase [Betaproteobacteria bacterium]
MESRPASETAHWKRLSELLDQALALPRADRAAWLDALPPDDAPLQERLRAMLAQSHDLTDPFMRTPVGLKTLDAAAGGFAAKKTGDTIGPYRLIRELGAGGMGAVWLAEREDGTLHRRVALKLPHLAWEEALTQRMMVERDILATLEHPHIARLYDAGMTGDGGPYLALEYVEGEPINVYCRERQLGLDARLKLFLQVAQALSYAHGKLIVHRDLKPNNILVTADGEVSLLDFGIAKLLTEDTGRASDSALTRMAGRALTLDYASPEQIRRERVTIATDVYSLGVVLFELLTGKRPYKPKRDSAGAIEDAVLEQEAALASRVAITPFARALRGDLDVILAKALKKPIDQRYASMDAFAADVKRYLDGVPVEARPDSAWYRTRKFIGRHRAGVGATAAAVAALGAGLGIALHQAQVARQEARRADEVKQFIGTIFKDAVPRTGSGGEVLAKDLLASAEQRIERELSGNPRVAAELGVIVAESFAFLGVPDLGEKALRAALGRAEAELGPAHMITIRAKVQLAGIMKHREPKIADGLFDEVIRVGDQLLPASAELIADAWSEKGFMASKTTQPESAFPMMRRAIEYAEKHLGSHHGATIFYIGLLANTYGVHGKLDEQLTLAKDAYDRAQSAFAKQRPHNMLTAAERFYGSALRRVDRPADAIPLFERALIDQRQLDTLDTGRVRYAMHELAAALMAAGRLDEALPHLRKVVELEQVNNLYESDNRVIAGIPLVQGLMHARRLDEAMKEDERIAAVQARVGRLTPRIVAGHQVRRAELLALRGQHAAAEALALNAAKPVDGVPAAAQAHALKTAALSARLAGQLDTAERHILAAFALKLPTRGAALLASDIAAERALIALDRRDVMTARGAAERCRQLMDEAQAAPSVRTHACVLAHARVTLAGGDAAGAARHLETLAASWQKTHASNPWHGEVLHWLSRARQESGRAADARTAQREAGALLARSPHRAHLALAGS